MTDLINFLSNHGFDLPSPNLDGGVHRFDRGGKTKTAWFIGWQIYSAKTAEPYIIALFGDWRENITHEYRTARKYNKQEQKEIELKIDQARRKQAEYKRKLQEETSEKAEKIWSTGTKKTDSEYLDKKGLQSNLFGCKTIAQDDGNAILVPCKDVEGRLWGLQRIFSDSKKRFLYGQKINTCFHTIGKIDPEGLIYVCEGFATAGSIHLATKKPVIVAFNSNNLTPVCQALRGKYEKASIVICGDEDLWTTNNKDEPYNPGRESAEKAAEKSLSTVVFPKFKNLESKPTDFNDLHILEGLDQVKKQVERVSRKKNYVIALGHNGDFYYYTSSSNKQIIRLSCSGHSKTNLLNIMPLEYWEALYPSKLGIDWDLAVNELMKKSRIKGIFNSIYIRGVGTWFDKEKLIINLGDSLWYDGCKNEMQSFKSDYIYEIGPKIPKPKENSLDLKNCKKLIKAMRSLNWKNKDAYKLMAGWLVLAPVCGALPWRPHLWVTGTTGCGKSYVIERINEMYHKYNSYFLGQSTEAGIRQSVSKVAKHILFDEFETNDQSTSKRIKLILELARQASSESDGLVVKGTQMGKAMEFKPNFSALVSSIRVNLTIEADMNRWTVLELVKKEKNKEEHFKKVKFYFKNLNSDYGDLLFTRAIKLFPVLLTNIEALRSCLAKKYNNQRFGQQYGALLGGYSLLLSDKPLTNSQVEKMCNKINLTEQSVDSDSPDEEECIYYLFNKNITVQDNTGRYDRSIGEVIYGYWKHNVDSYRPVLLRYGIKVDKENDVLIVSNNHPSLVNIFKGTKWCSGWSKSLKRLPDAKSVNPTKFGQKLSRGTEISLLEAYFSESVTTFVTKNVTTKNEQNHVVNA